MRIDFYLNIKHVFNAGVIPRLVSMLSTSPLEIKKEVLINY